MLSISIEKQRKRSPFVTFCVAKEMLTIFEIMFGGRICGQLLIHFVIFTALTKQANCRHRISTLTQSDDKPPWRNQVGGLFYTVKMYTTWSFAVNAKKHIRKRYTHERAKVSILWAHKQHQPQRRHRDSHIDHQRPHATRRQRDAYSGTRVEPPLLKIRCSLHRRGAYFF